MEFIAGKVYAVRVWKLEYTGITNQQYGKLNPKYRPYVTHGTYLYNNDFIYFTENLYNKKGAKMIAVFKIHPKFDFNINN